MRPILHSHHLHADVANHGPAVWRAVTLVWKATGAGPWDESGISTPGSCGRRVLGSEVGMTALQRMLLRKISPSLKKVP